jgi:hypothetical protein
MEGQGDYDGKNCPDGCNRRSDRPNGRGMVHLHLLSQAVFHCLHVRSKLFEFRPNLIRVALCVGAKLLGGHLEV